MKVNDFRTVKFKWEEYHKLFRETYIVYVQAHIKKCGFAIPICIYIPQVEMQSHRGVHIII
ncbi:hypothetical protein CF108_02420 [Aeromonas veronii]|nr:hypothetical protein CF108_02420 [Aeromonas veronii]